MLSVMLKLVRPIAITIVGTIAVMGIQTGFVWLPPGFDLLYEAVVAMVIGILWWRWQAQAIRTSTRRVAASARTVGMSVLCAGSIGLAHNYWVPTVRPDVVDAAVRSLWSVVSLLIAVGVVAPLLEEALFRHYLLNALRRQHGARISVLLSAVVFAAVHEDAGQWAAQFVAGIVLAYIMVYTGRLWLAAITHSALNLSGSIWIPLHALGDSFTARVLLTVTFFAVAALAGLGLRYVLMNTRWDTPSLDPASSESPLGALTLSTSR